MTTGVDRIDGGPAAPVIVIFGGIRIGGRRC